MTEIITNNLMVLGGGLIQQGAHIELRTTARADRAGQYFQDHRQAFLGEGAMILCSGGGSRIYDGVEPIESRMSEATLTANYLMNIWDVPSDIIESEKRSTTSTMNFVESIESGLLVPDRYSRENPLGVVTHRHNYWRARADIRDVGFKPGATIGIHPRNKDPVVSDSLAKEAISKLVRYAFFRGVQPGDLLELRRRNQLLEDSIVGGVGGLLRGMASAIQNKRR